MSARFATTQWSLVLAAKGDAGIQARRALAELCEAYWFPLYAYVRSRGHDPDSARDLTQGFFTHLLERKILQGIDPEKGRFRSFLMVSMKNFLSHEREKGIAIKRGGGTRTVSLDGEDAERRFLREPVETLTPEQVFERRWGLTVMERAMERLENETKSSVQRPDLFARLKPYLTGYEPTLPYREAARSLDMTEGAVKTAVYRLRQHYGRLLREEISDTLADPAKVDHELRHLLDAIRPWEGPKAR